MLSVIGMDADSKGLWVIEQEQILWFPGKMLVTGKHEGDRCVFTYTAGLEVCEMKTGLFVYYGSLIYHCAGNS